MTIQASLPVPSGTAGTVTATFFLLLFGWAALQFYAGARAPERPFSEFSVAPAMAHVRALAQQPRGLATPGDAEAREYILATLRGMGLEPAVQSATVQRNTLDHYDNMQVTMAVAHNIIVRLPGTASGHAARPPLLLTTHYDSYERSRGAAHAAAPVAALLETLRLLKQGVPLDDDIVALFADGEESGQYGSIAFVEQHPLAKDIGTVLQFDSAGSSGPLVLTDSSGQAGRAIAAWAALPGARGSSLMKTVYAMLPHAANLGALATLGQARLHFANLEGPAGPRRTFDTPDRLDPATLQQMGDTMLGLARALANGAHEAAEAHERVYFDLPVIGMVSYSTALVWPFTRLACLLFICVCIVSMRDSSVHVGEIAAAAVVFAALAAAVAVSGLIAWNSLPQTITRFDPVAMGAQARDRYYLLAFAALGMGTYLLLQRLFARVISQTEMVLGAFLGQLCMLLLASAFMPAASYVLTWPLIGAMLAFGTMSTMPARRWQLLVLLLGSLPAIVLLAPVFQQSLAAMTPMHAMAPMAVVALLLGVLTPVLVRLTHRAAAPALLAVFATGVALASTTAPEPMAMPQQERLTYYKDTGTWNAYWLLPDMKLDDWSGRLFEGATGPHMQIDLFGYGSPSFWRVPAPKNDVAFPEIRVTRDEIVEGRRYIAFSMRSQNKAPAIEIWIEGAETLRGELNGKTLTTDRSRSWQMSLLGMEDKTLDFAFELKDDSSFKNVKAVRVFVQERIPGVPVDSLPPRPPGSPPLPTPFLGTTVASDTLLFR